MSKTNNQIAVAEEKIISKIYLIRDKKVMLDRDLAELYMVETRILNQAVRRNIRRFPEDFMFQLTVEELNDWKSQNVISNKEKMGLRKPPLAFTELCKALHKRSRVLRCCLASSIAKERWG